jgi:membrane fusion protein (multidrug efflux system)
MIPLEAASYWWKLMMRNCKHSCCKCSADYESAQADILNAQAALKNAQISLNTNRGNIQLSGIKIQQAQEDYERNQIFTKTRLSLKKQLDDSSFNLEQAKQQSSNNESELSTAQSRIAILQASLQKAQAGLATKAAAYPTTAIKKFLYTKIYAPQSGKVGQTEYYCRPICAGRFTLFSIVNDTRIGSLQTLKKHK